MYIITLLAAEGLGGVSTAAAVSGGLHGQPAPHCPAVRSALSHQSQVAELREDQKSTHRGRQPLNLSDVTQLFLRNACVCSLDLHTFRTVLLAHTQASCASLYRRQQDLCWFQPVGLGVQIVQNQEQEAAEMAEQIQELEGDRQQLQVANEDLDLAEDRVSL